MTQPKPESGPPTGSSESGASRAPAEGAPTLEDTQQALSEAAKAGTNMDTLIGRLVVEQGLATNDEVSHALTQAKDNENSLAQVLVNHEFVTRRQLLRLKQIIEAERSGQQIPGYKLIGKLGAGAMATVYKGKQLSLDRMVAIKILPRKFSSNPQFIERFYAEGRAAAALNHPNIVQAFDVGQAGEFHYFVMEYVEGRSVHDDIVKNKRYDERDAVEVVIQIADALQHAHERGLIHRDVKPKNIMLTGSTAKLADMGLARAITDKEAAEAEAGKAFGTPYYISPEQIRGETEIGPPADIYSLGATLFHMVTGTVPFDGKNPSAVMRKHLTAELVPPDHVNPKLSAGVSEVIEMMMAKETRKRYADCKDLLVDLRAVKNGEKPPIAHRDVLEDDLASVVQEMSSSAAEIPEDSSQQSGGASVFTHPIVLVLGLILLLSLVFNMVQLVAL